MKKILAGLSLLFYINGSGQIFTLTDIIIQAKENSLAFRSAGSEQKLAQLYYASFKAGLRPSLSFYGNVPVYNKDNYAVTQPDGSIKFLPRSQNYSNLGIGFSQPLPFSGGTVSVNTDLYRFDDFTAKTKQYNGTPVFIRLSQPLFNYNPFKWDKQIAPLKLLEAGQKYKAGLLQLEYEVCRLFFTIITAQVEEQLATTNFQNNTANLSIEKRRVQLGVSAEDKVLQLEMQQIQSQQQQSTSQFNIRNAFAELYTYINTGDTTVKQLQLPETLPVSLPPKETVIELAKQNLPQYIAFQRKRKEAESKTTEAKMQGKQIDLVASYGLNNAAADISTIYRNPQDQQRFSIGFNIPITGWGKRKNSIAIAKQQQEQTELNIKQEEGKLIVEITGLAEELPVLKNYVRQSLILDTLSQKRFAITTRLFQSGKVSLLELQAAQAAKDNAKREYIAALRRFWESYYSLKSKTGAGF